MAEKDYVLFTFGIEGKYYHSCRQPGNYCNLKQCGVSQEEEAFQHQVLFPGITATKGRSDSSLLHV